MASSWPRLRWRASRRLQQRSNLAAQLASQGALAQIRSGHGSSSVPKPHQAAKAPADHAHGRKRNGDSRCCWPAEDESWPRAPSLLRAHHSASPADATSTVRAMAIFIMMAARGVGCAPSSTQGAAAQPANTGNGRLACSAALFSGKRPLSAPPCKHATMQAEQLSQGAFVGTALPGASSGHCDAASAAGSEAPAPVSGSGAGLASAGKSPCCRKDPTVSWRDRSMGVKRTPRPSAARSWEKSACG